MVLRGSDTYPAGAQRGCSWHRELLLCRGSTTTCQCPLGPGSPQLLTVLVHGRVLETPPHVIQRQPLAVGLPRAAIQTGAVSLGDGDDGTSPDHGNYFSRVEGKGCTMRHQPEA